MKRIDIPGVGLVDFPDSMTDAEISSAIETDILKTAAQPKAVKKESSNLIKDAASYIGKNALKLPAAIADQLRNKSVVDGMDGKEVAANPRAQQSLNEVLAENQKTETLKPGAKIVDGLPGIAEVGFNRGYAGLGRVEAGLIKAAADLTGSDSLGKLAESQNRYADEIEGRAVLRGTPVEGFAKESIVQDLPEAGANAISSVMQTAPSLVVGAATGGSGLPAMFGSVALQEYNEGRNQDKTPLQSAFRAAPMAGAEVLGEKLGGFEKLSKGLRNAVKGNGVADLGAAMIESSLRELPSEELTTTLQFLIDKTPEVGLNQGATFDDYKKAVKDTALATILQSSGMGVGGAILTNIANKLDAPKGSAEALEVEDAIINTLERKYNPTNPTQETQPKLTISQDNLAADEATAAALQAQYDAETVRQEADAALAAIPEATSVDDAIKLASETIKAPIESGTGLLSQINQIAAAPEAIPAADILGDDNVSNLQNDAPTALANSTIESADNNAQGSLGNISDQPAGRNDTGRVDNTAGTLAQSSGADISTGNADAGNDAVNRPFATADNDFLPKLRTMTIDPVIIKQIDDEMSLRGLAVPTAGPAETKQPETVLQNRDRSQPESIKQMRSIAANPDPSRLSFSRDAANGAPVVAGQLPASAVLGKLDHAVTANNRKLAMQYAVVEASDVVASHDVNGNPVAEYGNSDKLQAIGGNGRVAGLQEAFRNNNGANYIKGIAEDSALHGVPADAIRGMKNPVLIRVMNSADITPTIGDELNGRTNMGLSVLEQAKTDTARLKLKALDFNENGEVTQDAIKAFVMAMPENERNELMDGGRVGRKAEERLMAAVFNQAYGDDELVRIYSQAQDVESKAVITALANAAPAMARLTGAGNLDIRSIVADAAKVAVNSSREGVSLAKLAAQGDMELGEDVMAIVRFMAQNIRRPKLIGEELTRAAQFAYETANQQTMAMFDLPNITRDDVIRKVANDYQTRPQDLEEQGRGQLDGSNARSEAAIGAGQENTETVETANAGEQAQVTAPDNFTLAGQTNEEINAGIAAQEAAAKAERDQAKADEAARIEAERKARQEIAADNFDLTPTGKTAKETQANDAKQIDNQFAGQGDLLAAPQPTADKYAETRRFAEWALSKVEATNENIELDGKQYVKTSKIFKGDLGAKASKIRDEIGAAQSVFLINNETETLEVRAGGKYKNDYGKTAVISVKYAPVNNVDTIDTTQKRVDETEKDGQQTQQTPESKPAESQQAIEAIKQDDTIPTADKIKLAADLRNGNVTADDVKAIVGESKQNQETQADSKPKVDDFGEKLEGARKDMVRAMAKEYSDDEIVSLPLSKIWPATDINLIENKTAAAVAFAARQEIPSKPRKPYAVRRWVEQVKVLRNIGRLVSEAIDRDFDSLKEKLKATPSLDAFSDKVSLLEAIDRENWKRIGKVEVYPNAYRFEGEKKVPSPLVRIDIDGNTTSYNATNIADVVDKVNEQLGVAKQDKRIAFEVRSQRGVYFIMKKGDKNYARLKEFDNSKDAFAFIKNNYDEVLAAWEATKDKLNVKETDVRNKENRPRAGEDYRNGRDVSSEEFATTFGFRGIQFGEWVKQGGKDNDRQGALNAAYDALMDLASIVGVPPKALSLEGTLGLSFGARGAGKASAHFEPNMLVINLTKTKGAGTLAHEWFHALDNYFSRKRGGEKAMAEVKTQQAYREANYITYKPEPLYIHKTQRSSPLTKARLQDIYNKNPKSEYYNPENWQPDPKHPEGVRHEVEEAFADLVNALDTSPMRMRSLSVDGVKDIATDGYWSRIIERAARAFENYVIHKMQLNGYDNDYLANVVTIEQFNRDSSRFPYLLDEEITPVAEAFDNLFSTIKTKETEDGNLALHQNKAQYGNYETDLFGNPIQTESVRPGADKGAKNASPDQVSPAGLRDTEAPSAEYYVNTIVGAEQSKTIGASVIKSSEQLAQATKYLNKSAVEKLDGVITDTNGKPLAVIGGFKGAVTSANVYPSTIVAEAVRVDGAANLWLSHNHPSGEAVLSEADKALYRNIKDVFSGTGIEVKGLIAVTRDEYSSIDDEGVSSYISIPESETFAAVPVIERELKDDGVRGGKITSPASAKTISKAFYERARESGIILSDAQNRVVAWLPLSENLIGNLKDTGGLNSLYRAISQSNAIGAFIVHDGELTKPKFRNGQSVVENIGKALKNIDVSLLDAINVKDDLTASERGQTLIGTALFSRGSKETPGNTGTFDGNNPDIRYSLNNATKDIPDAIILNGLGSAKNNADYDLAKAGDVKAATRLAKALVTDDVIDQLKSLSSKENLIAGVTSIESTGNNALPEAAALLISENLGIPYDENLVQSSSPKRSSMNGLDRIFNRPLFEGDVVSGAGYIFVDDTITQGGTFAALSAHVKDGGGKVVANIALTGKQYSSKIALSEHALSKVRSKFGDLENEFKQATGYGYEGLTESEARYLTSGISLEQFRNRIAEESKKTAGSSDSQASQRDGLDNLSPSAEQDVTAGLPKQDVQNYVNAIKSKWKNAPEIIIAQDMHDEVIDKDVRDENDRQLSQGAVGQPEGFYYKGKVYILASEMNSQDDIARVLMHETLGHWGLRKTFGNDMGKILNEIALLRKRDMITKAKQYGKDLSIKADRDIVAEEILAEMAQTAPSAGFVKRAIAAIRNFLRNAGVKLELSDNDIIVNYLLPARNFVVKGTRSEQGIKDLVSSFSRSNPQSSLTPEWKAPDASKFDSVVYKLQDKNIDLKRVTQAIKDAGNEISDRWNAYLQEELYHGRTAKRTQDFLKYDLEPLINDMRMRGVNMADFEEYLWARHAEERNIQIAKVNPDMPDGGSGMTTAEARNYLANLSETDRKKYEALARRIDLINAKSRQVLIDYGLESAGTIAAWEGAYKHYVPLMREDMELGFGNGTGQGFSVKGNASKRATGSNRPVVDIIANIAQQYERNIIRGEKNRVATALIGLAKLNPNDDFWKVDTPPTIKSISKATGLVEERTDPNYKNRDNVVVARIVNKRGEIEERSVIFNQFDERAMRMAAAIKNLDQDQIGELLGTASGFTRYFASINTQYNPVFGVINITRDVQGALLNLSSTPLTGKQKEILANTGKAWLGIYKDLRQQRKTGSASDTQWATLFEEFQREGGQTGYRDMYANAKARSEALNDALNPTWWKDSKIGKVISVNGLIAKPEQWMYDKAIKPIFDWLSDYNNSLENAVRLSVYKSALDAGMTKQQAASIGKNISVNFNRKGASGRQIGALYAFFNASVQGTARIAETVLQRDNTTGKLSLSKAGKVIFQGGLLLGAMQALVLAAAGYDDDEPPEFVRDRSLIIPLDPVGADGKYITIPMPLGYNAIPATGRMITEWALSGGEDTGKRIVKWMNMLLDVTNPIGNAGFSLQTIAPTVLDPMAALAENKDFTGRPIAREDISSLDPTPGFTRSRDKAWDLSVAIARGINWATGGTDAKQGVISPTADQLEYLAGQFTGGVGRETIKLGTTVESLFTGEELPTYKIPLFGRFFGDTTGQSSQGSEFYNNVRKLNEHQAEIKLLQENNGDLDGYLQDNPEALYFKQADRVYRNISKLRKNQRVLKEQGADKADIKAIDEAITELMTNFNNAIREVKEKEPA